MTRTFKTPLLSSIFVLALSLTASGATSSTTKIPMHADAMRAPLSTMPGALKPLLAAFKKSPGIEANFTEEKKIALLAAPLTSSGKIYFHPPESLARVVEKPRPSHLVMTGKRIVVKDKNGRKEVDLSDKPTLRGLVSSLLHVLSGDEKKLSKDYSVQMTGSKDAGWTLTLAPRNPGLKKMVRSFFLKGKGILLSELRVKEASGDVTVTRFSNINPERRFHPSDVARLFGI